LKDNSKVLVCNYFNKKFYFNKFLAIKKIFILIKKHNKIKNKYDKLIIGYSDSKLIVLLAKLLSKKYLIWDAFYSKYQGSGIHEAHSYRR